MSCWIKLNWWEQSWSRMSKVVLTQTKLKPHEKSLTHMKNNQKLRKMFTWAGCHIFHTCIEFMYSEFFLKKYYWSTYVVISYNQYQIKLTDQTGKTTMIRNRAQVSEKLASLDIMGAQLGVMGAFDTSQAFRVLLYWEV